MRFTFTKEQEAFRREVHRFLESEMPPELLMPVINLAEDLYRDDIWELHKVMARKIGKRGWFSLTWPREYGGIEADEIMSCIFQEEMRYHGAPGWDPQGVCMVAPLIMHFGTEEQKRTHIPPIARGEIFWCEGYSEPDVGSDLASVRTTAVEGGGGFVINGQKLWTSGAHKTDWCHMLVRTDPDAPKKHRGLTYFLLDMQTEGITVRPVIDMCGGATLCEVFFDNVKVPHEGVVGGVNNGWQMAMALLNFERSADAGGAAVMRRFFELMTDYLKNRGLLSDPTVRHHLADIFIDMETSRLMAYRLISLAKAGAQAEASAHASMSKLFGSEAGQRVANTMLNLLGSCGQIESDHELEVLQGRIGHWYFHSYTNTLARGTSEIQRNILATRGLGLPRS
ncbi:MAG: acyl-CoA dehydrogenase family protein [Deltaproteobacteria bacterium]|nr:acyl-CoA dehydrogenase family protein [Deltaproteobacteria bacterium]